MKGNHTARERRPVTIATITTIATKLNENLVPPDHRDRRDRRDRVKP